MKLRANQFLTICGIIIFLFFTSYSGNNLSIMNSGEKYTYLALGDSYTIGEAVPLSKNFPNQVVQLLAEQDLAFHPPRIIATTGWTTAELEEGIQNANQDDPLDLSYDLVTLLIGVNDQYRGRAVEDYRPRFKQLLRKAIAFAGNNSNHVIVLSIPDWGVTPFASGRNRQQIAEEIDKYNKVNYEIAKENNVHYLDITSSTREAINDQSLLAADGLHPSEKEYERWGKKLSKLVRSIF